MDIRNPVFTVDGRIDCEILHPALGWIPFTADANDVNERGRTIFAAALNLGPEPYAPLPYDPPPLTIDDYRLAIDAHVEAMARSRQYNSAAHMASYVASTVPEWVAETAAFVAWRDQVWVTAIHLLTTVTEAPTIEAVIEALPQIEWPAR